MKKVKFLVIILLVTGLFSCKSVDFKRIHKEVEKIDAPVTETAEKNEETSSVTISPITADDEDLPSLTPLYENGELVSKEEETGEETAVTAVANESSDVAAVKEIPSSLSVSESASPVEEKTNGEKLPVFQILMGLGALLVILLIVLISVKASKAKGRKRKKPVSRDEHDEEEEKEFHYTFDDEEYGLYLSSLDFSPVPSDDDRDEGETEDTPDDPDTIIALLEKS